MCCETQRARAGQSARRATHKSRFVREPERRPQYNSAWAPVQYTTNTPPQNEGILSFALRRERRIDISGTLAEKKRKYVIIQAPGI